MGKCAFPLLPSRSHLGGNTSLSALYHKVILFWIHYEHPSLLAEHGEIEILDVPKSKTTCTTLVT
jgi:hypothetical protein